MKHVIHSLIAVLVCLASSTQVATVLAAPSDDVRIEAKKNPDLAGVTNYYVKNAGSRTVVVTVKATWKVPGTNDVRESVKELSVIAGELKFVGNDQRNPTYRVQILSARY